MALGLRPGFVTNALASRPCPGRRSCPPGVKPNRACDFFLALAIVNEETPVGGPGFRSHGRSGSGKSVGRDDRPTQRTSQAWL